MSTTKQARNTIVAAISVLATAAALAAPTTWTFSQDFGSNGAITGTFTGEDFNSDGLITYADSAANELSSLSVAFSGPTFSGSWSASEMMIGTAGGTADSSIVEFQYVVGSLNFDAILPGAPAQASVVTVITPVSIATQPPDSYMYWTAGSQTYDPNGLNKGNVTFYNTNAGVLDDFQSQSVVEVPEPSTYVMMALGLACLGQTARRRTKKRSAP